jgi:hypothetical protein
LYDVIVVFEVHIGDLRFRRPESEISASNNIVWNRNAVDEVITKRRAGRLGKHGSIPDIPVGVTDHSVLQIV